MDASSTFALIMLCTMGGAAAPEVALIQASSALEQTCEDITEENFFLCQSVEELASETTVVLCSHRLEEVRQLVNRVLLLEEGRLAYEGVSALGAYELGEATSAVVAATHHRIHHVSLADGESGLRPARRCRRKPVGAQWATAARGGRERTCWVGPQDPRR